MKILELFAGSRSIGSQAHTMGHEVFSVDWKDYAGINLVIDIEYLMPNQIPFMPDVIWLSPDCTTYSISAISHHRKGVIPKSEYAKKSDKVNMNAIALVEYYRSLNPSLIFFIENPRGMFRKMPFIKKYMRHTITYCQYGDTRMKPTDIFTNSRTWKPRPMCKNGDTCHQSAPRGSKTGTQGIRGSYDRSKIPSELCADILNSLTEATIVKQNELFAA